jgi:hypothetical protein
MLYKLYTLDLHVVQVVDDNVITSLFHLHSLHLGRCKNISNSSIINNTNIHTLIIVNFPQITEDIFSHLPNLFSLYIHGNTLTNNPFIIFHNLLNLNINRQTQVTDEAFQHLEYLDISFCDQITDNLYLYPSFTNLRWFHIEECKQFTDLFFHHLHNISHLNMSGCDQKMMHFNISPISLA